MLPPVIAGGYFQEIKRITPVVVRIVLLSLSTKVGERERLLWSKTE